MVSVIIPARNEIYLEKTIRNILANAEGDIEILVMLDGYKPNPPFDVHDNRVIFYHYENSIGQRQCVNDGARRAKGKYIMKLDAHCAVDKGFDIKLAQDCEYDWIVIPRMYNLDIDTWLPKLHKRTDYMYISSPTEEKPFRAVYYTGDEYRKWHKKPELIDDTMCNMGPGWFLHKDRYWELGGLDEGHGGWGQMGVEISCKAWLSGGSLKVNKKTWFAHWFRGGGGPGFPYRITGRDQERARKYSRDLWLNDKWPKATRKLQWLIDKFNPPGWKKSIYPIIKNDQTTIIYYTSNQEDETFEQKIREHLVKQCQDIPIISVSQKPISLGENICIGILPFNEDSLLRQVLAGLKAAKTKFCLAAESDFLYPPDYFNFIPPNEDKVYRYNNVWVRWKKVDRFYKKYYSEGAQICGRQYWIDKIEQALSLKQPATRVFDTKVLYNWGDLPAISFKTGNSLHQKAILDRKVAPVRELPYWGDCQEWK